MIGVSVRARTDIDVIARLEDQESDQWFRRRSAEPDVRVGAFVHERQGGASQVVVQVIETATGKVLQSSTLRFDSRG